jgi:hypothetical protein
MDIMIAKRYGSEMSDKDYTKHVEHLDQIFTSASPHEEKTETAQINEALCKVLCHNLCCVIQSMHELGIDPTFGVAVA